jgi:hypothetical protein
MSPWSLWVEGSESLSRRMWMVPRSGLISSHFKSASSPTRRQDLKARDSIRASRKPYEFSLTAVALSSFTSPSVSAPARRDQAPPWRRSRPGIGQGVKVEHLVPHHSGVEHKSRADAPPSSADWQLINDQLACFSRSISQPIV